MVSAARKRGILPAMGPNSTISALMRVAGGCDSQAVEADKLLTERVRILGGAVALPNIPRVYRRFALSRSKDPCCPALEFRTTGFGNRAQEAGAGVVSLNALYADPLTALRCAIGDRPHRVARPAGTDVGGCVSCMP